MSAWKRVALRDVTQAVSTWNPTAKAMDEHFDYVDLSAIDQDRKAIVGARRVACGEAPSRARQLVASDDVLISTVRPNLNGVARVPAELDGATASTGFCVLRADRTSLSSGFLFHWVKSSLFVGDMVRKATGASYPAVSDRIVLESLLALPPLPEQRRIAEVLDRAEALRVKRRAALAQLDSLTQSIFLDMFGDPARSRNKYVEGLGKHLLFLTSGGRGWAKFYAPSGSRFVRSLDVRMNHIGNDDIAFVSAPKNAEAKRTRVTEGDVLLTITGSRIGRVAAAPSELDGAYISQHVAILRIDRSRLLPKFLSYFLSLDVGGQRQIAKSQYGQTKPGLNFEQIERFKVPVPPMEMQLKFAMRVAAVDKLKAIHCAALAELDALFASLQHRAFRGEL